MTPLPLTTEFLFRMVLNAGAPHMTTDALKVVPVTGGSFEGPGLKGSLVPGTTADWLRVEPDGTARMDVRLVMQTDQGQFFHMRYAGVRHGPAEVIAALGRGEPVDPASYYFRISATFETSDPALAWLNKVVAVGVGQRPPAGPTYDVYVVR